MDIKTDNEYIKYRQCYAVFVSVYDFCDLKCFYKNNKRDNGQRK